MAQRIQTLLIDDLDGGEAAGTVRFCPAGPAAPIPQPSPAGRPSLLSAPFPRACACPFSALRFSLPAGWGRLTPWGCGWPTRRTPPGTPGQVTVFEEGQSS